MHQIALTESQKGVVRRYVEVWRRRRPGIRSFAELERDIENGSNVLVDGITVDARAELPVIAADAGDHKCYAAIFDDDDDAIDDMTVKSWTSFADTSFSIRVPCLSANGGVQDRQSVQPWLPAALQQRRRLMPKIEPEKAAKAGHVLFRYMRARHRFKKNVEPPLPAHELAQLIGGGKGDFDEIYIKATASPPVVFDGKADDVFEAIRKEYHAIGFWDSQLVAAWRHYVISDGPLPPRPEPRGQRFAEIRPTPELAGEAERDR